MTTVPPVSTTAIPLTDPELSATLTARLATVEARLGDAVAHSDGLADTASRHLVNAGGKRLRPLLALLCAELGDGARPEVVEAAVGGELPPPGAGPPGAPRARGGGSRRWGVRRGGRARRRARDV